jgi:hypothetical protein
VPPDDNPAQDEAEPPSPEAAQEQPGLEARLDDLAAFDFDLDPDDFEDTGPVKPPSGLSESLSEGLSGGLSEGLSEASGALELDEAEIEEIEELEDDEDDEDDPMEAAAEARSLYLEIDGNHTRVDKDRFVIGRVSKMSDLAIVDVNISRQHCAIEKRGDRYFLMDLGSINGVLLDGVKVDDHCIAEGDVFKLSGHTMRVTFDAPPVAEGQPRIELHYPTGEYRPIRPARPIATAPPAEQEPELEPELDLDPNGEVEVEPLPRTLPRQPVPGFEQRVELRLEQMAQQIVYLQQSVHMILGQMQQLQGLTALAHMVQQRVAAKQHEQK